MHQRSFVVLALAVLVGSTLAQEKIGAKTQSMERVNGLFPFYWDEASGKVWLEIPKAGVEFLYVPSLATGLGSNSVGLDRGKLGGQKLVRFEHVGNRVLLVQRNMRYRARTDSADERRAVDESFAQSVLWGGEVAARTGDRLLVDFTSFVVRDAAGVARALGDSSQGGFSLDKNRSVVWRPRCRAFPKNTELEGLLTFSGTRPGAQIRQTAPTPSAVTLRVRHSLVQLPGPGYTPRAFDPRCGAFSIVFADYATPLDAPLEKRWITRHRLQKKDPAVANSDPVDPIVYYVDRGAPEPVRTALVEGASWWSAAFAAAGFTNAFRVEVMPEGVDPLDARYNVIQWVHRSTRGWSYGNSVVDPRTGEIIKGHVSLGSLRVRQDRLIFEGVAPRGNGCAAAAGPDTTCFCRVAGIDPVATSLARIRQLSAHEVGHTLGFSHNFAASTFGRASVMDYPAPFGRLTETGDVDLRKAYAVGIGEWDKVTVRYAYTQWATLAEAPAGLRAILDEARDKGMIFVTDQDARAAGTAHPLANLWDNGDDPVRELDRLMEVRKTTLAKFSRASLPAGRPLSELEELFVPLYLQHRYQVEACAKMLGGAFYDYAANDDGVKGVRTVPPVRQKRALDSLLRTLDLDALIVSPQLVRELMPPHYGHSANAERFPGRTGALFDPVAAAVLAADVTISALLHPARAERLSQQDGARRHFGLVDVLKRLVEKTDYAKAESDQSSAPVRRAVQRLLVDRLMELAVSQRVSQDVRSAASGTLFDHLRGRYPETTDIDQWHARSIDEAIQRFRARAHQAAKTPTQLTSPPGSPIGR
ncbi:MAG: peptidase [Planctomycetes bacterium]|nr:peptidase [Planctomycetota bacterium]